MRAAASALALVVALGLPVASAAPAPVPSSRVVLLDELPVAGSGVVRGPVTVGAAPVRHAVVLDAAATGGGAVVAAWSLRRRCTALRATVAWLAPAAGGSAARVVVAADGRPVARIGVAETRPLPLRAALRDAAVLRITAWFPPSAAFGGHRLALLEPRLTCSGDPRR